MPWEHRHGVCAGGRRQEEGREDLSSSGQTCEGWGGRDGGRDGRPSVFISWTVGSTEAVKQDTVKTAATGLSVERTEASGNTQRPGARPSSSWVLCQRGSEQRLSDASSNTLTHTALSTRPVKARAGRAMALCCPDQMTEIAGCSLQGVSEENFLLPPCHQPLTASLDLPS